MYLEIWMLVVLGFVWIYSMYDLWKTGIEHGVDFALDMLEANEMILTDVNNDGEKIIHKVVRAEDDPNNKE